MWNDEEFDRTATFTLQILRKKSVNIQTPYFLTDDFNQILPFFRLQCGGDGIDGNLWSADSAGFYDGPTSIQGAATASVDGFAPSMTAAFTTGSGFEDDPMTLTLTPSLYWEYRDSLGENPKYDALTGAEL